MSERILPKLLLTVGILSIIGHAQAAEMRVNGFASIVGGKTISDEKLTDGSDSVYVVTPPFEDLGRNESARYDDDISFKPETNIGLQLTADLGDNLTIVSQLTAHGANDFDTEIEGLYVSYDINSQLNIKGGKQRIPFYLYSDYLDVGYAYHWIRPPVEVYGIGFSSYEGVSLTYSGNLGDWDSSILGYFGASDNEEGDSGNVELDNLMGVVLSGSNDWLQLRLSYHQADTTAEDVTAGATQPYAVGEDENAWFASFGSTATFGNFFVGTEFTITGFDELFGTIVSTAATGATEVGVDDVETWMVTAGYRMGKWTPHLTFATTTSNYEDDDINGNGTIDTGILANEEDSTETWTLGLRYDFHPSAALKVEYTDASDESDNSFTTLLGKRREASTIAVGIDVIF